MNAVKQSSTYGQQLREEINKGNQISFMGVHDQLSAAVAANYFNAFFVGGLGIAASQLGRQDIGYLNWEQILRTVSQLRRNHPAHHILVDIDDGFGGLHCAAELVHRLELAGASGVVIEDQAPPKRCGHLDGKTLVSIDRFCDTLSMVLDRRDSLFVVARTDAVTNDDRQARVSAYAELGVDALLMDGIPDLSFIGEMHQSQRLPFGFNQMNKGKSPPATCRQLAIVGVQIIIYSAPLLFAAQEAMINTVDNIIFNEGELPHGLGLPDLNELLEDKTQHQPKRSAAA